MKKIEILVPPAAILNGDELDAGKMTRYYNWMADNGITGLFLNGSTGEFSILTDDQKVETLRIARAAVGSRMKLIGGAIAGSPRLCADLARRYQQAGADAIAVCAPPFFKYGQPNILKFMRETADRSPLPVYIYDIPFLTSPMSFETIVELSAYPNIAGLKDSSRDFARFQGLIAAIKPVRPEFRIFTGTEELLLASLMAGADGATVATGGIEPGKIMAIVKHFQQGEFARAQEIQFGLLPLIRKWFSKDFPAGFRDAVAEKGFL